MVTVGHLLSPSESKLQTSCLVLRAMNKCHWEHAWEGRGWGTPGRSSADSFSFQTICCYRGIEDRDSKRPLVVTMKILIRAEALMGFIREGDVSLEDIPSHRWVNKMLHMPVKLLLCIPAALWCDFPALVTSLAQNHHHYCLGRCDFLREWWFPQTKDSRLRTLLERYQSLRRLKLETKWYRVWKPMK